jgi:hypothetical protein
VGLVNSNPTNFLQPLNLEINEQTASPDLANFANMILSAVSQEVRQRIQDAFSAFNKFLESPADPGLVDFVDRWSLSGSGRRFRIIARCADSRQCFYQWSKSTIEVLDNNPSQAFHESRQAGNVIGLGLPFMLEGGGVTPSKS